MRNQNQKRSARKGFTLVEVIVVLVVLAILAAIMIPAMTGWIDKAKEKRLVVACRTCVNAAQTLVVETYGKTGQATAPGEGDVTQLAGVPGNVSGITLADTAIATLTYTEGTDSATYERDPSPHYTYGAGTGGGTATLSIEQAANGMRAAYAALKKNSTKTISIYSGAEEEYKKIQDDRLKGYGDFFKSLPSDVKASLLNTTWTINRSKNKLYVYDGKLKTQDIDKTVNVTIYDLTGNEEPKTGSCLVQTATVGTLTRMPVLLT